MPVCVQVIASGGNDLAVRARLPCEKDTSVGGLRVVTVSRGVRAEAQRAATLIRQQGQRAGWGIEKIAGTIHDRVPILTRLESWRLAYGWSRRQALDGIELLYSAEGLAAPGVNTSMLCRWEHGQTAPSLEYADALTYLYRATPDQLGLVERAPAMAATTRGGWYRPAHAVRNGGRESMTASDGSDSLAALRESIELAFHTEGPAGGPETVTQLETAVAYYSLHYADHPPALLATEVHRSRALVTSALRGSPAEPLANDLRRVAGWLSGLLGNLAFYCADYPAAHIHLGTATRLGQAVGDARLQAWSLGAHSMVAYFQQRLSAAVDLADQGLELAVTPLQEAQLLAWAKLRPLAALGRVSQAQATMMEAQRALDADVVGDEPGRFGFDAPSLARHIAEAHLHLGDTGQARSGAEEVLRQTRPGRARWAAATLVIAETEAVEDRPDQAAELGHTVLDAVSTPALRETTRQRLHTLNRRLSALAAPGHRAVELGERITALPALATPAAESPEPNGGHYQ